MLSEPNLKALHIGRDYATLNLSCPLPIKLRKTDKVGDRIFIEGNSAAALGAMYGGATSRAATRGVVRRRAGVRVVSTRARLFARRCVHSPLRQIPGRSDHQASEICD